MTSEFEPPIGPRVQSRSRAQGHDGTSAPLTPEQRAAYAASVAQTEAIFALEGMAPTAQDKAIEAAILAGRVSPAQVREEFIAYVTEHKTVKGFIESRPWALQST